MSKQVKTILISASVFVLLVIALFTLNAVLKPFESSEPDPIILFETEDFNVDRAVVENKRGGYTFIRVDPTAWTVAELSNTPLREESITKLKEISTSIVANDIIEEQPEDYSLYGFDDPTATISVTYLDGSENTLSVGSSIPGENSYYFRFNDDPAVYSVEQNNLYLFTVPLIDLVSSQIFICDEAAPITSVELGGSKLEQPIKIASVNEPRPQKPADASIASAVELYDITQPVPRLLSDTGKQMLEKLRSIYASQIVAVNPTEEQLAECGLDSPYATISYTVDGQTVTLLASDSEESEHYIMREGTPVLYKVNIQNAPWIRLTMNSLADRTILAPFATNLSKIVIESGSQSYEFELKDSDGATYFTVHYGENELSFNAFLTFYGMITGAEEEEPLPDGLSSGAVPSLTITYEYKDGLFSSDVLTFTPATSRRVCVSVNGEPRALMKESFVSEVLTQAQNLAENKPVVDNYTTKKTES